MKIAYYNLGCKVNFADLSRMKSEFEKLGHESVEFGSEADITIINTCTVTNRADSDSRKMIRRARKFSPAGYIAVTGCYAQLKPDEIVSTGADGIFGHREKFSVADIISSAGKESKCCICVSSLKGIPFQSASSVDNDTHTRINLKIQDGCDYKCTYCTIPLARGKSRGMEFHSVFKEIDKITNAGFKEIILTGINLGEYNAPTGENFTDIIKEIYRRKPAARFRISSIEPNKLTSGIISLAATGGPVCPHFHIPLQSGSAEILKLMKRRYNKEKFSGLIHKINSEVKDCGIGIDVICGFPGETDEHFWETYSFLKSLPFTYLHVFSYSERDNTPAADMPGVVPGNIRKERTKILMELSDEKRRAFHDSQKGTHRIVIPERQNKNTKVWSGWTDNYINVRFPSGDDIHNRPVVVKLLQDRGEYMDAEFIRELNRVY